MYCLLDIVGVCIRPKGIFPNKKLEKEIIEVEKISSWLENIKLCSYVIKIWINIWFRTFQRYEVDT